MNTDETMEIKAEPMDDEILDDQSGDEEAERQQKEKEKVEAKKKEESREKDKRKIISSDGIVVSASNLSRPNLQPRIIITSSGAALVNGNSGNFNEGARRVLVFVRAPTQQPHVDPATVRTPVILPPPPPLTRIPRTGPAITVLAPARQEPTANVTVTPNSSAKNSISVAAAAAAPMAPSVTVGSRKRKTQNSGILRTDLSQAPAAASSTTAAVDRASSASPDGERPLRIDDDGSPPAVRPQPSAVISGPRTRSRVRTSETTATASDSDDDDEINVAQFKNFVLAQRSSNGAKTALEYMQMAEAATAAQMEAPDDEDEYRLRRERNNEAVRRSRAKARMKVKESELNCRMLARQFGELKTKIQSLTDELTWEKRKNELLAKMLRDAGAPISDDILHYTGK